MSLPALLVQTSGSLAAVLALAGLAWWMKLGGTPVLDHEALLHRAAREVADHFAVADFVIAQDGAAALARDADGQIMVIRRHGNRFAGRILTPRAMAHAHGQMLEVDCAEPGFGTTWLVLVNPEPWAVAINQLGRAHNA